MKDLLDILSESDILILYNIQHYIKELDKLPVEEFLDDKQIIKYIIKDNEEEEIISDSESELEIINVKEAV